MSKSPQLDAETESVMKQVTVLLLLACVTALTVAVVWSKSINWDSRPTEVVLQEQPSIYK